MLEDFLDNLLLFYERYDSHLPLALLADKQVNLVDLPDEPSPTLPFLW